MSIQSSTSYRSSNTVRLLAALTIVMVVVVSMSAYRVEADRHEHSHYRHRHRNNFVDVGVDRSGVGVFVDKIFNMGLDKRTKNLGMSILDGFVNVRVNRNNGKRVGVDVGGVPFYN